MTTFFLIASVVCGSFAITAIILFFLSVCVGDACYLLLLRAVGFGLITGLSLDGYNRNIKQESKEIVITTSIPAKIDTTITINNGVSDTTYTYHLKERNESKTLETS